MQKDAPPARAIKKVYDMTPKHHFAKEAMQAFEPAEKIGLVGCVNPDGQVHLTLITSIMAPGPGQLTLGQFCMGLSKWYMQMNPHVGFLVMTMDRRLWRGKARWTHKRTEGPEYEVYNEIPMFRYNTYFGINTVHYLDLVETYGKEKLPMGKIVPAAVATRIARGKAAPREKERILKPFAQNLFDKLDSLKFISYLGGDGFPVIIPAIQCQTAGSRRIVFSARPYADELGVIEKGAAVTVLGLNLKMQSVLVRGTFQGFRKIRLTTLGILDIDWVYNSMPPSHGQIYPEVKLEPVTAFQMDRATGNQKIRT